MSNNNNDTPLIDLRDSHERQPIIRNAVTIGNNDPNNTNLIDAINGLNDTFCYFLGAYCFLTVTGLIFFTIIYLGRK